MKTPAPDIKGPSQKEGDKPVLSLTEEEALDRIEHVLTTVTELLRLENLEIDESNTTKIVIRNCEEKRELEIPYEIAKHIHNVRNTLEKIIENEHEIKQKLLNTKCTKNDEGDEAIIEIDRDGMIDPAPFRDLVDSIVGYYIERLQDEDVKEVKVIYKRSVADIEIEDILRVNRCLSKEDLEEILDIIYDEFDQLVIELEEAIEMDRKTQDLKEVIIRTTHISPYSSTITVDYIKRNWWE